MSSKPSPPSKPGGKSASQTDPRDRLSESVEPSTIAPERASRQARGLFIFVLVLALTAVFVPRGDGTSTAPAGVEQEAGGRPTTLGNHLTSVTLIHFWATWCPPCITEIPALERLARDYAGKPGFQVMMVAVDDELEKVRPFVGEQAFSVLYDPQWEVAHRYGTRKLPETHLLINNRKIDRLRFIGATDWDNPQIRATLDEIIERVAAGDKLDAIVDAIELDRSLIDNAG